MPRSVWDLARVVGRRPPLTALLLAALTACDDEAKLAETPPRPIAWTTVEAVDTVEQRTLSGVVRAVREAPLSFEVEGRIEDILVDIGDRFEAGAILAPLDRRTLSLTRDERASVLAEARASLEEAESDYARQQRLFEEGWVSEAAFDRAAAARDTARSRVETARARLAIAEENLADTELRAPFAGRVAARPAEPSQRVAVGETVVDVEGEGAGFEVRVAAPETIVDRLVRGGAHEVRFPARPGVVLFAVVAEIGAEATNRNAFPVTLTLEEDGVALRSGMTAEVTLNLTEAGIRLASAAGTEAVARIPVSAFAAATGDGQVAFVFDEKSRTLERRAIVVVDVTGDGARVARGLEPGEIVAAKGLDFLRDGQEVALLGRGADRFAP